MNAIGSSTQPMIGAPGMHAKMKPTAVTMSATKATKLIFFDSGAGSGACASAGEKDE